MKRILLIKITSLGDMVHTLPLVHDLRRAYPGAKIDWVADASCADIPRWTVGIDRVIAPPLRQFKKNGKKWRDLRGILGAVRELRREPYNVAIDVHGVYKSAIVARLSRTRRRLGYAAEFLGESRAEFAYTELFGPHGDADCRHKMRLVVANALGYEIEPDLAPLRVGYRHGVRQILTNLVGNATKFTESGHVMVRVSTRDGAVRLAVEDSGIGVPAEVQTRIFLPFDQADGSMIRGFGGTGLGLAICAELAERMDGSIGIESSPGQGATFWVELPLPPARQQVQDPSRITA